MPAESELGSIATNVWRSVFYEVMAIWRTALSEDGVGGTRIISLAPFASHNSRRVRKREIATASNSGPCGIVGVVFTSEKRSSKWGTIRRRTSARRALRLSQNVLEMSSKRFLV